MTPPLNTICFLFIPPFKPYFFNPPHWSHYPPVPGRKWTVPQLTTDELELEPKLNSPEFPSFDVIYLELWKPGKQTFCNFSQLPLANSLFTVLFAYVFFFACFVVRDLCRSGCRQNYYLSPLPIFLLSTILCLTQVTVIWNPCAPKAGFGAV